MLFRIKKGFGLHRDRNGVMYKEGDIVPSETDLTEGFPDKFEKIENGSNVSIPTEPDIPTPEQIRGEPEKPAPNLVWDAEPFADVTDQFEDAEVAEMKDYREGKNRFYVVDPSSNESVHKKPLKSKTAVISVLAEYIEDVVEE